MSQSRRDYLEIAVFFWAMGFQRNVRTKVLTDKDGGILDDRYWASIVLEAKNKFGYVRDIERTLSRLKKMVPDFDPGEEFFEKNIGLRPSGTIQQLANCFELSNPLVKPFNSHAELLQYSFRKWLTGLVASVYGKPSEFTLVLTDHPFAIEFFQLLLPKELARYCTDTNLCSGRSAKRHMCDNILVYDFDLNPNTNAKRARFNSLATKDMFTFRNQGQYSDRKRLAVLGGIVSNAQSLERLLNYPACNRRIIPVYIDNIDEAAFKAIDKTALLMEAFHAWKEETSTPL
ncbi:hypothetical protein [Arsenicibacter rosenii]|uniref:Uncharacterized protein n=1 Tax=Arsenicibacter rosenii TaxID=1750698 RepID=A0A1S2VID2_9BACT|nr:hypothetical protein [Arsenicibacter rosenii]OIN58005.1 hypothetical protein BLX24_15825 [Arsenicibacter rosenii]